MNVHRIFCTSLLTFLMFVGVTGCGGPKVVPVEGRVTLDDQPFENVQVLFYLPGGGPETNYIAITDAEGHFALSSLKGGKRGVSPGAYSVTLTTAHWPPDALETDPPPKELVAPSQREHEFKVSEDGATEANFSLTSK